MVLPPVGPLTTTDEWFDALMIPPGTRMRRNPRFMRILEEFTIPSKYTPAQKAEMLHGLKFGLACDPKRAGFKNGLTPYEMPASFNPDEMPGAREHMPNYYKAQEAKKDA